MCTLLSEFILEVCVGRISQVRPYSHPHFTTPSITDSRKFVASSLLLHAPRLLGLASIQPSIFVGKFLVLKVDRRIKTNDTDDHCWWVKARIHHSSWVYRMCEMLVRDDAYRSQRRMTCSSAPSNQLHMYPPPCYPIAFSG